MGGNINIKLPRGKNPEEVIDQIRSLLAKSGYTNIQFNVKRQAQYSLTAGSNTSQILLDTMR